MSGFFIFGVILFVVFSLIMILSLIYKDYGLFDISSGGMVCAGILVVVSIIVHPTKPTPLEQKRDSLKEEIDKIHQNKNIRLEIKQLEDSLKALKK